MGKVKIDPSRGLEPAVDGSPADGRGGRLCHRTFAGICDSLHGADAAGLSGGNDHCNSGVHDRSSNRCRKPPHSHRQHRIVGERQHRRAFGRASSSTPESRAGQACRHHERLITLRVVDCLSQSPLRTRTPTVGPVGVLHFPTEMKNTSPLLPEARLRNRLITSNSESFSEAVAKILPAV
jgi:hypothetical protein